MIRNKPVLVGLAVGIAAIRVLGHSPTLWLYGILEVVAYVLILLQLFWPTVIVTKGIAVTTTCITRPGNPLTQLSPIASPSSPASEASADSIQCTIRTIESAVKRKVCHDKQPLQPLIRSIPGGFSKPVTTEIPQSRVSKLVQSVPLPKVSVPTFTSSFDPETKPMKEMNAFEETALKRLTEIRKQVEEAVKSAQKEEIPVLLHTPSIVDLPEKRTEMVIREGQGMDIPTIYTEASPGETIENTPVMSISQPSAGARPEITPAVRAFEPHPMTIEPPAPVQIQTPPRVPPTQPRPVPPVSSVYPQVEMSENPTTQTHTVSYPTNRVTTTHLSSAIPRSSNFTASRDAVMDVVAMQESQPVKDTYSSRLAGESSRPAPTYQTSSDLSPLVTYLREKEHTRNSIGDDTRKEIIRFSYSITTTPPTTHQTRRLKDKLNLATQRSDAPLHMLCEQIIKQNIEYLRQSEGLSFAEGLVRWVLMLGQEWSQLEECFLRELKAQEPLLHPGANTHPAFATVNVPVERSYALAILYGFLMRAKSKVTIADCWSLLASYLDAPYDSSCARVPAVIAGLLRVVGSDMSAEYDRQFFKVVNLIVNVYFKEVPLTSPSQIYIQEVAYLTAAGRFPEPVKPVNK